MHNGEACDPKATANPKAERRRAYAAPKVESFSVERTVMGVSGSGRDGVQRRFD
jgi:hypothetical protein